MFKIIALHLGIFGAVGILETLALAGVYDFRESPRANFQPIENPMADERLRRVGTPNAVFQGMFEQDLTFRLGVATDRLPYKVELDQYGLRNPPGKQDPKVLLLGDSIVFAANIPIEDTVAERMELTLNIPVMNLGEWGYSPQEELIRLEGTGIDVADKVVIQFIFEGNDLLESGFWRRWMDRGRPEWPQSGFLRNLLLPLRWPTSRAAESRIGMFTDSEGQEVKVWVSYTGRVASYRSEMEHLKRVLETARTDIESRGGIYGIVFVPAKIGVLHSFCRWPITSIFRSQDSWASPFGMDLKEFCKQAGISFRDLTGPLKALAEKGVLPYFAGDTHLNSDGHATAATYLASWIQRLVKALSSSN